MKMDQIAMATIERLRTAPLARRRLIRRGCDAAVNGVVAVYDNSPPPPPRVKRGARSMRG